MPIKTILLLATVLSASLAAPALPAEDSFGLELIQGVELKGELSDSFFSVGMTVEAGTDFVSGSTTSETVAITGNIYPATGDMGATADVFVVVASPEGLFMRNPVGSFVPWNGKASDLVAAEESVALNDTITLELHTGSHTVEGLYRYFVAYLVSGSSKLVYSAKAARFTATATIEALLWRVSNGTNELIVGGTIHLLREDDFPLHPAYTSAYEETDILVTEVAGDEFDEINSLAVLFLNDDGIPLINQLSTGLYQRLDDYLSQAGEDISNYELVHHNWVAQTLHNLELDRIGYESGVDYHFLELAAADGKENTGLESLASQILLIKNLEADSTPEQVITEALDAIDEGILAVSLDDDIDAWKAGDIAHFVVALADLKQESPEDYERVFTDRNESWIPDLEFFLSTPETEYVLVGAGHLVGEDSVLAMLETRGLVVERYQPPR